MKYSGMGMNENQINDLFKSQKVESTEGTHAEIGTGIGLNLAKEYLEQIGETIRVTSELNKGSTFEFSVSKAPL